MKRLSKKKPPIVQNTTDQPLVRLQKFLAASGVGSRRDCEVLIVEGRIEVDGQVVTELGTKIDPETADVRFDGERVRTERLQYYVLNKPPGVVSTSVDPSGRTRVVDLISSHQRVYNVGRLDKSSEGLILVTNDGSLAQYLTHPSYGIEKVYQVLVKGFPQPEDLQLLKAGVHLAEGVAKVKDVEIRKRHQDSTELKIILDEGKNREIRRLLAKLGHKVVRLIRIAIGPIQLGTLPQGAYRRLTNEEVQSLKEWSERTAKGQTPKTVIKPSSKSIQVRRPVSSDQQAADPVQKKLAEHRPIHFDDIEKSKAIRAAEREASAKKKPQNASGDRKSTAKKPMRFNAKSVGGIGASRRKKALRDSNAAGRNSTSGTRERGGDSGAGRTSTGRGTGKPGKFASKTAKGGGRASSAGSNRGKSSRGASKSGRPSKSNRRGGRPKR